MLSTTNGKMGNQQQSKPIVEKKERGSDGRESMERKMIEDGEHGTRLENGKHVEDMENEDGNSKKPGNIMKRKTLSKNPLTKVSQENKPPKTKAKNPEINSISDLKEFLAWKKREREEKSGVGPVKTEDKKTHPKTTQVAKLFPSLINETEDDSVRQLSNPCALTGSRALNQMGD